MRRVLGLRDPGLAPFTSAGEEGKALSSGRRPWGGHPPPGTCPGRPRAAAGLRFRVVALVTFQACKSEVRVCCENPHSPWAF